MFSLNLRLCLNSEAIGSVKLQTHLQFRKDTVYYPYYPHNIFNRARHIRNTARATKKQNTEYNKEQLKLTIISSSDPGLQTWTRKLTSVFGNLVGA